MKTLFCILIFGLSFIFLLFVFVFLYVIITIKFTEKEGGYNQIERG